MQVALQLGPATVKRKRQNGSEIREASCALLSDIEARYTGAEFSTEGKQPEEFFGPIPAFKLRDEGYEPDISVSWPNLAISMRDAKRALQKTDADGDC